MAEADHVPAKAGAGPSTAITLEADGSAHGGQAFHEALAQERTNGAGSAASRSVKTSAWRRALQLVKIYLKKWAGRRDSPLPVPPVLDMFWSCVGAFLSILAIAGLNQVLVPSLGLSLLVASFGASAVLVFGVIDSKLAQPRNFIGGQLLSAVIGCSIRLALGKVLWLSAALGMALALLAMQLTQTTHPPGGATALIAASAPTLLPAHGFQLVAAVGLDCLIMQAVALVVNNLHHHKSYPTFWIGINWPTRLQGPEQARQ